MTLLAEIIAVDPLWRFAADPAGAVGNVTARAATADRKGQTVVARLMTHTACALVVLADNPLVERGAVLNDLVRKYGAGL